MRIKKLNIAGMGIAGGEYELHPNCTVITGANGSGKTTIANGLRFALTKETSLGKALNKTIALLAPNSGSIKSEVTFDTGKAVVRQLLEDGAGCTGSIHWKGGHKGAPAEAMLTTMLSDCVFGTDLNGWRILSAAKQMEMIVRAWPGLESDDEALKAAFQAALSEAGFSGSQVMPQGTADDARNDRNAVRKNKQKHEKALQVLTGRIAKSPEPDKPFVRAQEEATVARQSLDDANGQLLEYIARSGSVEAQRDNVRDVAAKLEDLEPEIDTAKAAVKETATTAEGLRLKLTGVTGDSERAQKTCVEDVEASGDAAASVVVMEGKLKDASNAIVKKQQAIEATDSLILGAKEDPFVRIHRLLDLLREDELSENVANRVNEILAIIMDREPDVDAMANERAEFVKQLAELEQYAKGIEHDLETAKATVESAMSRADGSRMTYQEARELLEHVEDKSSAAQKVLEDAKAALNRLCMDRDSILSRIEDAEGELEKTQGVVGAVSDVSVLEDAVKDCESDFEEVSAFVEYWRERRALEGECETVQAEVDELETELTVADAWLKAVQKCASEGLAAKLRPLTERLASFVGRRVDIDLSVSPPRFDITLDGHSAISGGERLLLDAAVATGVYGELKPELPLVIIEAAEADHQTLAKMLVALSRQTDVQAVVLTHLSLPQDCDDADEMEVIRCEKVEAI